MLEEKIKLQLLRLLEYLEKYPSPQTIEEWEDFLIAWLKVRKIAQSIQKNKKSSPDNISLARNLLSKFNRQIKPHLTQFQVNIKKQDLKTKLNHIFTKLEEFIGSAAHNLKTLPMESYNIYQNALIFIELYRFAFSDFSIYRTARKNIIEHLDSLKTAFEREAGKQDLEEEEQQLSQKLTSSFKGSSPNVPQPTTSSSTPTPKVPSESGDEFINATIEFPEEGEKTIKHTPSPTLHPQPSSSQLKSSSASSNVVEVPPPQVKSSPTYAFSNWFPTQNSDRFKTLLYCDNCGRLINFQQKICMGCRKDFSGIIEHENLA